VSSVDFSFDATGPVQNLLTANIGFVGVRVTPTSSPNYPNLLGAAKLVLTQ
jgi:hypothetical protein